LQTERGIFSVNAASQQGVGFWVAIEKLGAIISTNERRPQE
jgi:hypothetical protein